jgi:hypothetical protein
MKRFSVSLEQKLQQKLTHWPNGVLSLSQGLGNFFDKKSPPLKELLFSAIRPSGGLIKNQITDLVKTA